MVFTRNAAGELVSKENHGGTFEYEYDAPGNLCSTRFADGRELAALRYGTGHLLEMQLRHGGRRTRWRPMAATACTVKSPAARARAHRKPITTPRGASRSARCRTPAGSWCSNAATAGTAPTR
ncbi:hypothetical protein SNN58_004281 [Cronobacter dublinensis]|nr:hypothetical protein [Cronobacter dublinensis]ELY3972798.1 hypothetical protein [Cronobacter dublinensis]ELY4487400.1 hypothetical protein [Cronobacter dublinensis]ELY5825671.1 hypothetical protein [Cronobacter dublinensis]